MAHLCAPNLVPVPLPRPRSRSQTHTMSYACTPAPSPSPSSLEAWRNKPKRIEGWSCGIPAAPGADSWGKGVGVGSAKWSGETAETDVLGNANRSGSRLVNEYELFGDEREVHGGNTGVEMGMDRTDGGTEPTTFKNGRLPKSQRAGEVVREQRRLGSQGSAAASAASKSTLPLPTRQASSATKGEPVDLVAPIIIPATINTRAPPTPFLALPSPLSRHHDRQQSSAKPIRTPSRSVGSDVSAHSARSIRDAYIESALHIPMDLLAEVQAEPPREQHLGIRPKEVVEAVRKSKSIPSQQEEGKESGSSGVGTRPNEGGGLGKGEKRSSGGPLALAKTWPRADIPHSLPTGSAPIPTSLPVPPTPSQSQASPGCQTQQHAPDPAFLRPIQTHRKPTPALRPALSRSATSVDAMRRSQRDESGGNAKLQTRFEPRMYPLPGSESMKSRESSPTRPYADERIRRLKGSWTSHQARKPIHFGNEDPTHHPGFPTDRHDSDELHNQMPSHPPSLRADSPRLNTPEIAIGHSTDPHLHVTQSHIPSSANVHHFRHLEATPAVDEDRISFEIPSSGARGRLRVSLAWFKDVRSPRRRRDREGPAHSPSKEVPPPLPTKDLRWRGSEGGGQVSPLPRSHSPVREERYRPNSPIHSRPRSPVDITPHRPSSRPQSRDRDYLAPPEPNRDKVRFSPVLPEDMRSPPTPWSTPGPTYHPYNHPTPSGGIPPSTLPNQQHYPHSFPQYPKPWLGMTFGEGQFLAGPPAPYSGYPTSPRRSIELSSIVSPQGFNQSSPPFHTPQPFNRGRPYIHSFHYPDLPNTQAQGDFPWPRRPTIWQRIFTAQNAGWHEDAQHQRPMPARKERWIKIWRTGVRGEGLGEGEGEGGTTVFGGDSTNRAGYAGRAGRGPRTEWWRLNGRRGGDDAAFLGNAEPYRRGPAQTWANWRIGNDQRNRSDPTRIGQNPHPYFTSRPRGIDPFTRPTRTTAPTALPLDPLLVPRTGPERAKEERRAQQKERRNRRYEEEGDRRTTLHPFDSMTRVGGQSGKTLHPFDSVTHAGGNGVAGKRPVPQLQQSSKAVGRLEPGGAEAGRGSGRVRDWVQRVSSQWNPVMGGSNQRKVGGVGSTGGGEVRGGGVPWKQRLKARGRASGDARKTGAARSGDGKLRREVSGKVRQRSAGI